MESGRDVPDPLHERLAAIEDRLARLESTLVGGEIQKHAVNEEPPKEVGTAEAAEILGVSKDTVLKFMAAGLLEFRNTAPPGSSRPVFAFTLRSVMELRTSYEREEPTPPMPSEPQRRRGAQQNKAYKHVKLED